MPPLHLWALTTALLFIKVLALAMVQGICRIRHNAFTRPEDAACYGKGTGVLDQELDMVQRAQNALRNDGEKHPHVSGSLLGLRPS